MNITLIILGVVILILLYILYTYYSKSTTTLISTASLKATNPQLLVLQTQQILDMPMEYGYM